MNRSRPLALLLAGAALLAACGDDGGGGGEISDADAPFVEALQTSLTEDEDFPGTDEQLECLAGEFVTAVGGGEALEEAGITPEELAESDSPAELGLELDDTAGDDFAAAFGNCDIDLAELLAQSFSDDGTADPEVVDCLDENLDDGVLEEVFAAGLVDPDAEADLMTALEPAFACFTP